MNVVDGNRREALTIKERHFIVQKGPRRMWKGRKVRRGAHLLFIRIPAPPNHGTIGLESVPSYLRLFRP